MSDPTNPRTIGGRAAGATLTMPPETEANVEQLARRMGVSTAEVFSKALALLSAALDADEAGKAVGIAETPDALETQIVGLRGSAHAGTGEEA